MSGASDRQLLQHFLASLAYRVQKALRGAPDSFATFRAAPGVRTPHELIRHMTSVLGFARAAFVGGGFVTLPGKSFDDEVRDFHRILSDLREHLRVGSTFHAMTPEQLLQGPFADAMTHAGQLAMLRRFAGCPVPPEDFSRALIDARNVGLDQPDPASPDAVWLAAEEEQRHRRDEDGE